MEKSSQIFADNVVTCTSDIEPVQIVHTVWLKYHVDNV